MNDESLRARGSRDGRLFKTYISKALRRWPVTRRSRRPRVVLKLGTSVSRNDFVRRESYLRVDDRAGDN